jgi:hypothetical protein
VPLTTAAPAAAHGSSAVRVLCGWAARAGPRLLSVMSMARHAQGMILYESTSPVQAGSRVRSWLFWRAQTFPLMHDETARARSTGGVIFW